MPEVSIIIVSYNTKNLTLSCISSVVKEGSKLSKEIIIVDNGSRDGSLESIAAIDTKKSEIPIRLIKNDENLGFSKANNQGIKIAKGKYILLLNSDTQVEKRAIIELIEFAEKNPEAGVVGPKLLNPDRTVQPSVFNLPTVSRAIQQYWLAKKRILDKYFPAGSEPVEVESLVMAGFLITPKAFEKVGLLGERYFMFYEDLDFCRRVRYAKLKVYYLPTAEVSHYHGASGKKLANEENQWRRLIPSSIIYHGRFKHYLLNFIIWSAQKWGKLSR